MAVNVFWAQTKTKASWHIVATYIPMKARCGRMLKGEQLDERPQGKTCETCLRLTGPQ